MLIVTYQSVTGLFQDLVQRTFRGLYKSNKMHVDIGHQYFITLQNMINADQVSHYQHAYQNKYASTRD